MSVLIPEYSHPNPLYVACKHLLGKKLPLILQLNNSFFLGSLGVGMGYRQCLCNNEQRVPPPPGWSQAGLCTPSVPDHHHHHHQKGGAVWHSPMMEQYSATKRSKTPDSGCILCDCIYVTF